MYYFIAEYYDYENQRIFTEEIYVKTKGIIPNTYKDKEIYAWNIAIDTALAKTNEKVELQNIEFMAEGYEED